MYFECRNKQFEEEKTRLATTRSVENNNKNNKSQFISRFVKQVFQKNNSLVYI